MPKICDIDRQLESGIAEFGGTGIEERQDLAKIKNPWGKLTPGHGKKWLMIEMA
jgi:hypothetical protein